MSLAVPEDRDAAPGGACDGCLARAWLLAALSGHLDRARGRIAELLALGEEELIGAVGGGRSAELRRRLARFDAGPSRLRARAAGVELICGCQAAYPPRLRELPSPPAVLHVAGGAARLLAGVAADPVAIVGARAASPYGASVARMLGRGLAAAGLGVLSGLAVGIDSAAHQGALAADQGAPTVAVLPGPAGRAYPPANRRLHRRILAAGNAVSELPPGTPVRGWMFPARNRIIAALAAMTVVVEAGERSGALITARVAAELGRPVGAVPGQVTAPQARGSNALLKSGAELVRGAQDVLDLLYGTGTRPAPEDPRPRLDGEPAAVLAAIARGHDTLAALNRRGVLGADGLAALAALELEGYVRRGPGGRYVPVP
jgi:DNA processing protein